jgi:TonB family protein
LEDEANPIQDCLNSNIFLREEKETKGSKNLAWFPLLSPFWAVRKIGQLALRGLDDRYTILHAFELYNQSGGALRARSGKRGPGIVIDNPWIWGETPLQKQIFIGCFASMAHHSMFDPDPADPDVPTAEECVEIGSVSPVSSTRDSDVAELVAKFTAHAGGRVTPEVSADLALDIVLNGIVEQACLATPATGAAIVLQRAGEWVCRASSGSTAPSLGARLEAGVGLSGACIQTRRLQRCDDAQADPRADVEASRNLGVRSVLVAPLLLKDELVGVFEVFSAAPSVFSERDERTLQALSRVVLANLQRSSEPAAVAPGPVGSLLEPNIPAANQATANLIDTHGEPDSSAGLDSADAVSPETAGEKSSVRGIDFLTWVFGTVVLAIALMLMAIVGQRLGGRRFSARPHAPATPSARLSSAGDQAKTEGSGAGKAVASTHTTRKDPTEPSSLPPSGHANATAGTATAQARSASPPAGSLLVYQNGKEIFRLPPTADTSATAEKAEPNRTQAAGATGASKQSGLGIEPATIYEISPEVAESSLLRRVEPEYPEQARRQQIQGPVVLDVHAGRDGSIQEVKLLSGQSLLAEAAIAAVKQWRFRPRRVNGQPVEMQTKITLNFKLPYMTPQ